MAIDLEAIRKRVKELSTNKTSNAEFWKPGPGDYKVRCLPWPKATEGSPFIERWFNYIPRTVLAPSQFGKPDPIEDLRRKLFSSGNPDDRTIAKKLMARMRAFAPIIVRGQENLGVQIWGFNKIVYQKLLGYFLDEEVGDILDVNNGFDINVKIIQTPGKQFADIDVEAARRPKKLSEDPEQIKKWLSSVPDIDEIYTLKSYQEISNMLTAWLNGDETKPEETASDDTGVQRGPATNADAVLDELVNDVKSKPESKKPTKASKAVVKDDEETPESESSSKALDDAFDELMADDD